MCLCVAADGGGFSVWRCLLLPDSHKHTQDDQAPEQLLQLLRQLRHSTDGISSSTAAAAVGANGDQPNTSGCIWMLLMLRGGHFAGAVVRINGSSKSSSSRQAIAGVGATGQADSASSSSGQHQQQQRPRVQQVGPAAEPFTVLAHKTLHRYVVRWVVLTMDTAVDASQAMLSSEHPVSHTRQHQQA